MGMIVKHLEVTGDKGKKRLRALFDTSASDSLIKKRICEEISSFISLRFLSSLFWKLPQDHLANGSIGVNKSFPID